MKKKKRWLKIGIGLLSVLLIIDIVASFYFYNLAIERNVKDFLVDNSDLEVSAEAMDVFIDGDWREWVDNQDFEQWELESYDGLKLQGYFLEAKEPTDKTVVLAHGYLGRARDMGLYGQYYYEELGYNIFTADLRGHGESEGDYIGFGWHDRLDYIDWIDMVLEEVGTDSEIVLHGVSMGAATVLMASGEELPDNVKAIVADSPYTSVYDMFDYQMGRMFNLPAFPILPSTSVVTNMRAGYSLSEASALDQVKKAEVPILYIHGNADTFVPTKMTEKLYENTKSEAEMITFDNAGHGEAFVTQEDKYVDKLNKFLDKYLR
ncbi:alpha/beta hydrolase [Virgibacillus profundi]|uniref:Alpha/beta hydrolase n=1 Tax=Virgibacillus profundi TaxID=2024555 RepID=A0A2A2IDS2_9BACI|nr:alpha/beta hydrolase [Virgibacillus profundi]PAV29787.1 alpha/beta hydrolase [Virgibacillus profundi]PXY53959.1 alpha/beta hydrolase [Virgibacillus profundi]